MSDVAFNSNTVWDAFKADVADSFSSEQRQEIERVFQQARENESRYSDDVKDLRLSFKWFFIRLIWGSEKRNVKRIRDEQVSHPASVRDHFLGITSLLVGYTGICILGLAIASIVVAYLTL